LPILRKLSAEGAIISPEVGIFVISSPLIRLLILQKVLPVDRRKFPVEPIPRTLPSNFLDIKAIIFKALHYFNPEHIRTAYQISYKKNRGSVLARDVPVPSESVYHFEMYSILAQWFPNYIFIHPEVNVYHNPENRSQARVRDDILITEGTTKYLIEFEASEGKAEIRSHAQEMQTHRKVIGANQACLLYFAPENNFTWPGYTESHSFSIAVVHNSACSTIFFYTSPSECTRIQPF